MPNTPIQSVRINGWSGGLVRDINAHFLGPNDIHDALNVEILLDGGVRKRKGFSKVTDDVTNQDVGEYLFLLPTNVVPGTSNIEYSQLVLYIDEDEGRVFHQTAANLLASPNVDLVDSDSTMGPTSYSSALDTSDEYMVDAFVFNDFVYVTGHRFAGKDAGSHTGATEDGTASTGTKPLKYDIVNDSWSRISTHDLDGSTSGIPRALSALVKYDRVFYANVAKSNSYDRGYRIYWSEPFTAEEIKTNSFIGVGSEDGTQINKLVSYGESILVFKDYSVWILMGATEKEFSLYSLANNLGTNSPHSVAGEGNDVYFFDSHEGVIKFDGAEFTRPADKKINNYILDNINRSAVFKVRGFINRGKYYLSVPWGEVTSESDDHNTRTFVLDLRTGAWTEWDYGFADVGVVHSTYNPSAPVATDGPLWGVQNDDAIGIFKLNDTFGDNGNAYDSSFTTGWLRPGETLSEEFRLRRATVLLGATGDDVAVELRKNYVEGTTDTATLTPASSGDEDAVQETGLFQDNVMNTVQFKFSNDTLNEEMDVRALELNISSRERIRGKRL